MSTYSNGSGYPINADKLQDLNSVLHELPDNTNHYISPKYVRDAVYTTWENIIFKPTTIPSSSVEYIGIDQTFFSEKLLLGRKLISSGQYVLSNDLLNSNGDIFLYNTTTGSNTTTLVFLAGTGSNFYNGNIFAPTINTQVVNTISDGNYLDLNISNNTWVNTTTPYGGNININSQFGFINLNSINIPTNAQNLSANVGNVLSISSISAGNVYLQWSTFTNSSTGGSSSLYYSNNTPVPQTIGGILAGSTFNNVPIQDIITRLLYPYLPPTLNLSLSTYFIEIGNNLANPILNYSIGVNSTYSLVGSPSTSGGILGVPSYPILSNIPYLGTSFGTSSISFPNNQTIFPNSYGTNTFTMSIHDTYGSYVTSSTTINIVLPWYWGTSVIGTTGSAGMPLGKTSSVIVSDLLTPLLTNPATQSISSNNKTLPFTGQNKYVYFGYPSNFPYLEQILDGNGFDITGSFKTYSISLFSPNSYWSSRYYTFYIYTGPSGQTISTTTLGSPLTGYSENLTFLFATAS